MEQEYLDCIAAAQASGKSAAQIAKEAEEAVKIQQAEEAKRLEEE